MSFLYITEQGAYVHKKCGRIVVAADGETLADRALSDLSCCVVFGGVQVSTDAMMAMLDKGCDVEAGVLETGRKTACGNRDRGGVLAVFVESMGGRE